MAIDRKLLGKAIRQVRELRGLSQVSLAEAAGLQGSPRNSVALIERGEQDVSMETLNALAEALDVPAACLTIRGGVMSEFDVTALIVEVDYLRRKVTMAPNNEALAEYAHDAWCKWMIYLFRKSTLNDDDSMTIPPWLVERWSRQMQTKYGDLPEEEKGHVRFELAED